MVRDFPPNEQFSFAGVHPSSSPFEPGVEDASSTREGPEAWIRRRPMAAACAALAGGFLSGTLVRLMRSSGREHHVEARSCVTPERRVVERRVPLFIEFPPGTPPPHVGRNRASAAAGFAASKLGGIFQTSLQGMVAAAIGARVQSHDDASQPAVRPAQPVPADPNRTQSSARKASSQALSDPEKSWWRLLKGTFSDWVEDKAPRLGAALAYYTVFSIAPLLVIVIGILGIFQIDARGAMQGQLQSLIGPEGAKAVQAMLEGAHSPEGGAVATAIGVVALLFGASGVVGQLKDALNTIWEVEPRAGLGIWGIIRDRLLSFGMVLGIGFLLLVSLVLSAALATVQQLAGDFIPGPDIVAHVLDITVSLAVVTVLFAMIFKYLPDVKIGWRDVWLGAFVTAVLFTIGKYLIGLYLGNAAIASSYGAAGSVIIVLLWAYYSSQILFLGAEFTQEYARMYGSRIEPSANAVPVTAEARAQQGLGRA